MTPARQAKQDFDPLRVVPLAEFVGSRYQCTCTYALSPEVPICPAHSVVRRRSYQEIYRRASEHALFPSGFRVSGSSTGTTPWSGALAPQPDFLATPRGSPTLPPSYKSTNQPSTDANELRFSICVPFCESRKLFSMFDYKRLSSLQLRYIVT